MTFFNKKEEILEIKLTSRGRYKLSLGKFKPVYYSFFDDDVLYDGARGGIVEDNNDIEPRIQENTPSLRLQTSFKDLQKEVRKQNPAYDDDESTPADVTLFQPAPSIFEDNNRLNNSLPLGKAQLGNQYFPSWRVEFLKGEYKEIISNINVPEKKPIINIPQIAVDLDITPKIVEKDFEGVIDNVTGKYIPQVLEDKFIRVEDDFLLFCITEENADILNDSLSIEVYEVVEENGEEVLKSKVFRKEVELVRNDLLLDASDIESQTKYRDIDDNYVEYWFDITVDDYIDNKTKYEHIVSRDFKGTIFDNKVGYEEFIQTPGDVLYTTENDEEEC